VLQARGGGAVGLVFGQRPGDEPEGVLGLAVGELVRPGFPVRDDAQAHLVGFGQRGEHGVDLGEVGGPAAGQGQQHAGQQGPRGQLPVPHADGQHRLDGRRDAGGVGDFLQAGQRDRAARRLVTGPRRRAASPRAPRQRPGPGWR
jgi:hypothetical protein